MKTLTTTSLYKGAINSIAALGAAAAIFAGFAGFTAWAVVWPILLLIAGLVTGTLTSFKNPAWFIGMLSGGFLTLNALMPQLNIILYLWPAVILSGVIWGISLKHTRFKWNDIESLYKSDNDLTPVAKIT